MDTRFGQLTVGYSARGIPRFSVELWHDGLKKHRLIRGESEEVVRRKAELQTAEWHERWSIVDARLRDMSAKASGKAVADERTAEAQRELDRLGTLLAFTLTINDAVDWENLKDHRPFPEPQPALDKLPPEPQSPAAPLEPNASDSAYRPVLGLLDKLMSSRRDERIREKLSIFKSDHAA